MSYLLKMCFFKPFIVPLNILLHTGHVLWKGTEVNRPLAWGFMLTWLAFGRCGLFAVAVRGKISPSVLAFVSHVTSGVLLRHISKFWDIQLFQCFTLSLNTSLLGALVCWGWRKCSFVPWLGLSISVSLCPWAVTFCGIIRKTSGLCPWFSAKTS